MNYAHAKSEIEVEQFHEIENELTALTIEQLEMIAGGECVVNQL